MSTPSLPVNPGTTPVDAQKKKRTRSYILYYRYAKIPQLFKVFEFDGDLQEAIRRGREHCIKMGYLFILVLPFLVSLEDQEQRKASDPENFRSEEGMAAF